MRCEARFIQRKIRECAQLTVRGCRWRCDIAIAVAVLFLCNAELTPVDVEGYDVFKMSQ